jgi:hypothetical protein
MANELDLFARPELIQKTSRFRELDKLDRLFNGTQYEGRPDWWTGQRRPGDREVPLRERKPCIIYRLPKASAQQVVRFLFGEGRFPKVAFEVNEETDGSYPVVSEDDAEVLQKWTASLIESAGVQPAIRVLSGRAIACRTSVAVVELQDGEFRFTYPRAQDCSVEFRGDSPDQDVKRLVWCYEFDKEVADPQGNPITARYVFRREWDETSVHVYEDAEVKPGQPIAWGAPVTTQHGLSFCPVVWMRNEADDCTGIDGNSLFDGLFEEFEALDMALSRRHQGIIYLGAPQIVETGVADGDGPDETGRKAMPEGFSEAISDGPHGYAGARYAVAPKARRIAPDAVWTYEGEKVDVKMIETSGKAFEVGTAHVNDIRSRLLETMGVVLTSMADTVSRTSTSGDMSARFLQLAHAPLIALAQEYRQSWWPKGLRKLLSLMLRMTAELSDKAILVPGTTEATKLLQRFRVTVPGESESNKRGWIAPRMTPHWGRFFDPSSQEIKTNVEAAVSARDGKVIANETAAEFVSHDFDVDNVQEELDEIAADQVEAESKQLGMLRKMGIDDGNRSGLPSDPEKVPPGGDSGRSEDGQDDAVVEGQ